MEDQMNVNLLDCTLRDGGHVNNASFGKGTMQQIVQKLVKSKVDLIELGFLMNGDHSCDQSRYKQIESAYDLLPDDTGKQDFAVMIRPDWYDIGNLSKCDGRIQKIRFAFYYRDFKLLVKQVDYVRNHGYNFFLNPVNIMSYSDVELRSLLREVKTLQPYGVAIVDTFGSLMKEDLKRVYQALEDNLPETTAITLHLHENMSLSFSLAQEFIALHNKNRKVYIDGSLLGMGRIPGNLCIEVIMVYLNNHCDKNYELAPVYDAIYEHIEPIKHKIPWGYSPAYFLTAVYKMHRSYAEFLLEKEELSCSDIDAILLNIQEKKDKDHYNESLVERLYRSHIQSKAMSKRQRRS